MFIELANSAEIKRYLQEMVQGLLMTKYQATLIENFPINTKLSFPSNIDRNIMKLKFLKYFFYKKKNILCIDIAV